MRCSILLASVLLVGCSGKLKLDEATVDAHLDDIDATWPLCSTQEAAPSSMRVVGRELSDLSWAAHATERVLGSTSPRYRSAGSCGGSLDALSEHANGITDYELTFAAYCIHSDDGDVVVDGVVRAREEGTPSDSGPIVSALESSTDGPLTIAQGGSTMELTLDDARVQYGIPAAWAPSPPDEQHPDVLTVGGLRAVFPGDDDREDYVRNLRIERVGSTAASITIVNGQAGTSGEGHVEVHTAADDPVVFDFGQLQVTSGTVVLDGAGGSVVTLKPDPSAPGTILLTLDGVPYDRDVDCTAARIPLVEVGWALLMELPIH